MSASSVILCYLVGDAELDGPSAEVRDVLSEAAQHLDDAAAQLENIPKEVKNDRPQLYRAESAADSGRALVTLADPSVTPSDLANEVRGNADALRSQVQLVATEGSGDVGGAVEALLQTLMRLRQPNAVLEKKAKEAAVRYRQSLDPRIRAVTGEVESLEARLAEVQESTTNEVASVGERVNVVKTEIAAAGERVSELISDQDSKFTDAQEERRKEFAGVLSNAADDLTEARSEIEERRDAVVARLQEIEDEVSKTAAALGGTAVAISYGEESERQAELAFRWTVATILLLLAAAVVPVWIGVLHAAQSPESVAGKITVALIIAGVAGYVGGLAHHHRERAARARRLQIELNAFGPFIAPLDQADRDDLRSTILWRFFGPDNTIQEPDGEPRPGRGITQLIRRRRAERGVSESNGTE